MARKIKVDMTNVESYGKCDEGIHTAKIASIEQTTSQGGDDMLKVIFEVVKGKSKGAKVFDNFVLTEKALWKFQLLLKALKIKCDGKLAIDLDKLEGKLVDIEVAHEEYQGQMRARVNDYTIAGTKATDSDTDYDEDDEDDEEELEEEEEPKKAKKSSKKSAPAAKQAPKKSEPEPEEDDEWEDEEEEEEEEPPKKPAKKSAPAKSSKPAKKAPKKSEPEEDDEWEDDEDEWEDEEDE